VRRPARFPYRLRLIAIEAVDGAESVAKAVSQRPDLVLMDIQLPVLDGYDDAARARANP